MRLTLALAALTVACLTPAAAEPPLWRLAPESCSADADGQVWLFGAFHSLPPDAPWRTPAVEVAFRSADIVYFEVAPRDDERSFLEAVARYGRQPDTASLWDMLKQDEADALRQAAHKAGAPIDAFGAMRPWYAAAVLSADSQRRQGSDLAAGVEASLAKTAKFKNMPIRGLETYADQLRLNAQLPETEQLNMLHMSVAEVLSPPDSEDSAMAAWLAGDLDALETALLTPLQAVEPVYKSVIITRNAQWSETLSKELTCDARLFIAVGAAHVVGPNSLQTFLARQGIAATRTR